MYVVGICIYSTYSAFPKAFFLLYEAAHTYMPSGLYKCYVTHDDYVSRFLMDF